MSETYEPKLVHLPGSKLTPEVVLHRTLNKIDHIKAVLVVIQWNDESFSSDWSQMKTSELVMGAGLMRIDADREAYGSERLGESGT